jgi:hypothetical protein
LFSKTWRFFGNSDKAERVSIYAGHAMTNQKLLLGFVVGVLAASSASYFVTHWRVVPANRQAESAEAAASVTKPSEITASTEPESAATAVGQPKRSNVAPAAAETSAKPVVSPKPVSKRPREADAKPEIHLPKTTAEENVEAPDKPLLQPPVQASAPPVAVEASVETKRADGGSAVAEPRPVPPTEPRVFKPAVNLASAPQAASSTPGVATIAPGTVLAIRISEGLSSDRNVAGDEFTGTLDQPLVVGDFVLAERGARVQGRVADAQKAGRVRGLAQLSLELTTLHTSDGQTVYIRTAPLMKEGPESKKDDAVKVGIGAALGAAIGAMAGGGKGAAIGAAAGGAAGGGTVAATRGKPVVLPAETRLEFHVSEPVTLTERAP